MIILDSSILVGIIKGEEVLDRLLEIVVGDECVVGAPTLVETRAWCTMNLAGRTSRWLEEFVDSDGVSVIPFGREMADVASRAFATFGRGSGHPAKLNVGGLSGLRSGKRAAGSVALQGERFRTHRRHRPSGFH